MCRYGGSGWAAARIGSGGQPRGDLFGSGALSAIVYAVAVVLIILACTVALGVAGGVAVLILRARQDRPGAPIAARVVSRIPPGPALQLEESHKPAPQTFEHHYHGPSIHIHGADGQEAAAKLIRKALTEGRG